MIETQTGATVEVVEGDRGEFTVWLDERCVAKKSRSEFPSDEEILQAVRGGN